METGKQWPLWLRGFMSPQDAQKIEKAVHACEVKTSGEVVPMIVRRSSAVGHVPFLLSLIFMLSLLVFEIPQMDFFAQWNATWLLFFIAALCFLISIPLSRLAWVQRLMVPRRDQIFQADERALLEFYTSGMTGTKGRTGVLIFISLMERHAVVLADHAISEKLPKETWEQICQHMVEAIKQGRTADGLISAIERSGELLAQAFPHGAGENINELSNVLILKE